jgi:hypothetical protein
MYWPEMDSLDDEQVTATYELIAQLIEDRNPECNPRRGVAGDMMTKLQAILHTASLTAIERLHKSLSLQEIARDPDAALPEAVDALASNFGVERGIARKSRGKVTLILRRASGINVGTNQCFKARGQRFYPTQPFSVLPPGTTVRNEKQVLARALDDGTFMAEIEMISEHADPAAALRLHDELKPVLLPSGFVAAYAAEDFSGGPGVQSNAELVRQMRSGLAAPGFGGPENIKALVRQIVPNAADILVTGEPGKVHIHLRSLPYPHTRILRKHATLKSKTDNVATWTYSLTDDEMDGFYKVHSIRAMGSSPHAPSCKIVGEDFLTFTEEGETFGLLPDVSTKEFDVAVLCMPHIGEVQAELTAPEVLLPGLEVEVRPVKPLFIKKVDIEVECPLDEDKTRAAVAAYVNNLPIGTPLRGFALAGVVEGLVNVTHDYAAPGGDAMDKTTALFLSPEDVTITMQE